MLDAAATGGALALMTLYMPPGAGAPPQRHTKEAETLLVREGELLVELEGAGGCEDPAAPPPPDEVVCAALERGALDFSGR